jgi:CBS domain-containing protein
MLKAKDIMKKNVVTIHPDAAVKDLAEILNTNRITGVPVVDDEGELLGMISGTDVIKRCDYVNKELAKYEDEEEYDPFDGCVHIHRYFTEELFEMKIRDLMSTPVFTLTPDASFLDVCKVLTEKRIHRVTIAENGKLKGIIATLDVIKLISTGAVQVSN